MRARQKPSLSSICRPSPRMWRVTASRELFSRKNGRQVPAWERKPRNSRRSRNGTTPNPGKVRFLIHHRTASRLLRPVFPRRVATARHFVPSLCDNRSISDPTILANCILLVSHSLFVRLYSIMIQRTNSNLYFFLPLNIGYLVQVRLSDTIKII